MKQVTTTYTIIISLLYIILFGAFNPSYAGVAALSWTPPITNVDGTTLTDLTGYKIYYGTSTGSYNTNLDIGNVTTANIINLTDMTTYYFAVTAYDISGNESSYSNEVSKTIPDSTPPVISNITTVNLTSTSNSITWTTDEIASSQIEYGTTTSYGTSTTLDTTMVNTHTVTLGGLLPMTTYHFRITSLDSNGNPGSSADLSFTTTDLTPPAGTISINSDAAYTNNIYVIATLSCTDFETGCSQMQFSEDGTTWGVWETYASSKSYTLSNIEGIKNLFAKYQDSAGNTSNSLSDSIVIDKTIPSGALSINNGVTYATTTWVTLIPTCSDDSSGCSQMRFSNDNSIWSPWKPYSTSLAWQLSGSDGNKIVYIQYKDNAGNLSAKYTSTITIDSTSPAISGITSGNITTNEALISWATNEAATSQVDYGTSTSYGSSTTFDANLVTNHSILITGLSPATTYHFSVKSKDPAGNIILSGDYSFITATPPDTTAPVISAVSTTNITTTDATVTWTTDEVSTSQVEFGTSPLYGSLSNLDNNIVTSHSIILSGLTPNTTYNLHVLSLDQTGNQGISPGYSSFTTLKTPQPETPAPIVDIRVRTGFSTKNSLILDWTATGANGTEGTATSYDLRASKFRIIEDGITTKPEEVNFSKAPQLTAVATPAVSGSAESFQVNQHAPNSVYFFAIKAIDEKGNVSAISNVINGNNIPALPVTALRNGYTMISIPLATQTSDAQTLLSGIVGSPVQLFWWRSNGTLDGSGSYIPETNIVPGYGYLIKSTTNNAVLNISGTAITDPSRTIPLQAGWNMIGNPYPQDISLINTYIRRIDTGELKNYEDAVIAGWVGNALYNYNGNTYNFVIYNNASLRIWQGYWIVVLQTGQYELVIYKP